MNKPETFANLCLVSMKVLIARKIRTEIKKGDLKYREAAEIFGISMATVCKIMQGKEASMPFDTLHNAAVSAGMTISIGIHVPD